MIFGKLLTTGVLVNMSSREPLAYGDGSTDVPLVEMPSFLGPYAYDSPNKLAIFNSTQAAFLLEQQHVQEINAANWNNVRCYVAADVITTLATFSDITGLSFPIGANEIWNAEFKLFCQGNTAGIKIQMTGPASPVRAVIGFDGNSTTVSLKTFNPKASPAYGSPSIAYCVNSTPFLGLVVAYLQVANGPTPGVVKMQLASTTAGQSTRVSAGSYGSAQRAA